MHLLYIISLLYLREVLQALFLSLFLGKHVKEGSLKWSPAPITVFDVGALSGIHHFSLLLLPFLYPHQPQQVSGDLGGLLGVIMQPLIFEGS